MTKEKISPDKLFIVSAILAVTNMGQRPPSVEEVARVKHSKSQYPVTLEHAVFVFAQQYMETDEHQRIFEAEAKGFKKNILKDGEAKCRTYWNHAFELYERA